MRSVIEAGLGRFNDEHTGNTDIARPLVLLLSHPDIAEIIGGLWSDTGWGQLRVGLLFVPPALCGIGLGRTLMQQA